MISTEKATQSAILDFLLYKGIFHWRNNTGAFKPEHGGFIRYGTPGSPDIFALKDGKLFGIEVKDVKGKLNDNQFVFRTRFEQAGGKYVVARSLDDVMGFF